MTERTKYVSSRPMALVLFIRLRSASKRPAIGAHCVVDGVPVTGELAGYLFDRASVPTWSVAHLAARVVSRQSLAAMRWSPSTQHPWDSAGSRSSSGASSRPTNRCAIDGEVDVVDDRTLFHPGRSAQAGHRISPTTCSITSSTSGPRV